MFTGKNPFVVLRPNDDSTNHGHNLQENIPIDSSIGYWHNASLEYLRANLEVSPQQEVNFNDLLPDLFSYLEENYHHEPLSTDQAQQLSTFLTSHSLNRASTSTINVGLQKLRATDYYSSHLMNSLNDLWEAVLTNAEPIEIESRVEAIADYPWNERDRYVVEAFISVANQSKKYWETYPPSGERNYAYIADAVGAAVGAGLAFLGGVTSPLMPYAGYVTGAFFSWVWDHLPD